MKTAKTIFLVCAVLSLTNAAFAQIAKTEADQLEAANNYLAAGETDKAIAEYNALILFSPRNSNALGMRGYAKMLKGDVDGAITDYDTAIRLAPNAVGIEKAYNNRGIAYQFKGDHIRAFNEFDKAISINPNYASAYNGRGVIYERRGMLKLALADFNKAIELNPNLTPAYSGRADVRFQNGELDLALADYKKAIEMDPEGASAHLRRGVVYGMKNSWEPAVADLKEAFELQREADPLLGGTLSTAFLDLDKYIIANTKNARAYAVRGFVDLLRKKDDEADKDFDRGYRLEPALKRALAELVAHVKLVRK